MPAGVGIGLRTPHHGALAATRPALDFLEVHSENFFGGGAALATLLGLREDYAVSLHGVGLSLGGTDPLDEEHLARLAALAARCEPLFVSEHLAWGSFSGRHANEQLPMPYTGEAVAHLAARIARVQEALGREILVENVTAYHRFPESTLAEAEFVVEVCRRAGCRLLLDVNNVHVNAANHGFDAGAFIAAIPPGLVAEVHLAGHEASDGLLVDTHAAPVDEAVWALYARTLRRFGPVPTLVERDAALPPLPELVAEAHRARRAMHAAREAVPA